MMNGQWGHCRTCKHFTSPARVPLGTEEARCSQPVLSGFELTVYGSSGCRGWELRAGLAQTAEDQSAVI